MFNDLMKELMRQQNPFNTSPEAIENQRDTINRNKQQVLEELKKLNDVELVVIAQTMKEPNNCGSVVCVIDYMAVMLCLNQEILRRMNEQAAKEKTGGN